jgi:hypothetical protein
MVRNRGGLLAATGSIGIMASLGSRFRAPDGDDGAGGGGGGGSGEEDDDFFAGSGGDGGGGEGGGGSGGGDGDGKDPPAVAEWMKSFSGEKPEGEKLSNQEWLAKIGAKDLDDVATRYRAAERGLRESGKVKVPVEGASEAEVKAFREAVGAPDAAEGYEVKLPDGMAEKMELDADFLKPMQEAALKWNVPKAAFAELADKFMAAQAESYEAEAARNNGDRDAKLKEWGSNGGDVEAAKAEFKRGMQILGIKTADVTKIQAGFGAGPTMDLVRKIGTLAGEDVFAGGGGDGKARFGYADKASAQTALDAMIADKDTAAKLRAKDAVTVRRYNQLTDAVAHYRQLESQAR